jgi:hypothetical protein
MRLLLICLLLLASIGSAAAQSCCSPGTTLDNKGTVILDGQIVQGDEGRLLQFLARNPGTILMELNSPGGSLRTGMAIGRIVGAAHLQTYVGPNSLCASACAMIWLAGAPMVASTILGFESRAIGSGLLLRSTVRVAALAGLPARRIWLSWHRV